MIGVIFKPRKSKEDLQREQYKLQLAQSIRHNNGVRVNETLVGKIREAKMNDGFIERPTKIAVQNSVERPMSFGDNVFDWLDYIRNEAKMLMNKNHQYEKQEKAYQERVKQEVQEKALANRRKFFVEYGVLSKQPVAA